MVDESAPITIVVCSGGLDSVTLAWKVAKENDLTQLLSFDYGQRHLKELTFAARAAATLRCQHQIIDLSNVGASLTGSALTDDLDVPDGHYAEENMQVTIVPNRNAIMLAVAFGVASSLRAGTVAVAVHGGDHFIYPDCRPGFIQSFEEMQRFALEGVSTIKLYAPFLNYSKKDIVLEGEKLGVPFEATWSCYKGTNLHCGRCGTCVERQEAFHLAGIGDPTSYEDDQYWREVTSLSL